MNLRNGQITLRELLSNPKAYQILQRESPVPLNQDRKSTRLNSSHKVQSRMPSSA